jgi:signal transduction histidine kinase
MSPARSTAGGRQGWTAWSQEVERLEKELAVSRAREHKARREVEETRERFERLLNAVRHSDCRHIKVGLDITREEVSGYVEDDGRGFGENGKDKSGLGLRSIKERVALLHGTARMYSSPEGGAGVRVRPPLRNGG